MVQQFWPTARKILSFAQSLHQSRTSSFDNEVYPVRLCQLQRPFMACRIAQHRIHKHGQTCACSSRTLVNLCASRAAIRTTVVGQTTAFTLLVSKVVAAAGTCLHRWCPGIHFLLLCPCQISRTLHPRLSHGSTSAWCTVERTYCIDTAHICWRLIRAFAIDTGLWQAMYQIDCRWRQLALSIDHM